MSYIVATLPVTPQPVTSQVSQSGLSDNSPVLVDSPSPTLVHDNGSEEEDVSKHAFYAVRY